ncbi:MAG: RNA polymerase sigma factor [Saccharofermentanales bacterium]
MEYPILDYIEPIYRFCIKRLSNRHDAEDLSQEILLCILNGSTDRKIENFEGYIWRIAHNRYARKIESKNRQSEVLYGDDFIFDEFTSDILNPEDELIVKEEYQNMFSALHSLSSMYRDILVDFYVHSLCISEIACKYGVSSETVKWRLHTGKDKIKGRLTTMNKTYEKIKMHVMNNGSFDPNKYLSTQLYKAIALSCYEKPLSIEEISLSTGIPTLYLEEALDWMIYGDAIEKVSGKYRTNFIILFNDENRKMQKSLEPAVSAISKKTWEIINSQTATIRSIGFYGSSFNIEKLGFILIPIILRGASDKLKRENKELQVNERPLRKDGGNGWFIINEGIDELDEHFAGCNQYYTKPHNEHGYLTWYWTGGYNSGDLNSILREFENFAADFNDDGDFQSDNEELTAKLLKNNIIAKIGSRYKCLIPIMTKSQENALTKLFEPFYDEIIMLIKDWIFSLYKEYNRFVPAWLKNQIAGNVDGYSFNVVSFVILELQKQGLLRTPSKDEIVTDNIFYTKK